MIDKTIDDKQKLLLLYELYEQILYNVAFSILNDIGLAEDVTQECFIKISKKLSKIFNCSSNDTKYYLMRMCKNLAIDRYRKRKRENHVSDVPLLTMSDGTNIENEVIDKEQVELALQALNDTSREIILLRCFLGLSYEDVANRLNITTTTAMKRFQRAMESIERSKGEKLDEKN